MIRGVTPEWPNYGPTTWRDRLFVIWQEVWFAIQMTFLYALAYLCFAISIASVASFGKMP